MTLSGALRTVADDLCDLAAPLAARLDGGGRRIAVAEGDDLAIYQASSKGPPQREAPGRRARKAGGPVELRVPAGMVITHSLSLPAAGRDYLGPILDHRLERLTPWAPDRVVYGYEVKGEAADGGLAVDFAATSRDVADRWTARAEAAGLRPTALGSAAEPLDRPLRIDLWRGARDLSRARVRRGLAIAAAIVGLVLVPLCLASFWTLYTADQRLAAVEARAATARRALQAALGGGAGSAEAALLAAKRPETAIVTLIDRLANVVPEDTVLRDLEIDPERVRIAGSSAASAGLIGALEASGVVRGARFAAPVTRGTDGRDGFEIMAARAGAPTAAPTP